MNKNHYTKCRMAAVVLMTAGLCVFIAKEAMVSEIYYTETDAQPLEEYLASGIGDDIQILMVKGPEKTEVFREVTFPKETHYEKKEETNYKEFVYQYSVEKVIHSDSFNSGDRFWVWEEPAYGYEEMKLYHEEGALESPIVTEEKPNYPIKGDRMIVFVAETGLENPSYPKTYHIIKKEGVGAEKKIKKLSAIKPGSKN